MKNKVLSVAIMIIMAISLFAVAGCGHTDELAEYKSTAKAEIETYAVIDDYTADNWALVQAAVTDGKTAVDAAADKAEVDTAVTAAKTAIDAVISILAEYKITAKTDIENYAAMDDYGTENWDLVAASAFANSMCNKLLIPSSATRYNSYPENAGNCI